MSADVPVATKRSTCLHQLLAAYRRTSSGCLVFSPPPCFCLGSLSTGLPPCRQSHRSGSWLPAALTAILASVFLFAAARSVPAQISAAPERGTAIGGTVPRLPPPVDTSKGTVYLSAVFASEGQPIRAGLLWRVFNEHADNEAGQRDAIAESRDSTPVLNLPDGDYIVHVSFGLAGATRRVTLKGQPVSERIMLNAGALQITGTIGDTPIPPNRQTISIYVPERTNSEGKLVLSNARPSDVIGLPEGNYHIVSTYLDTAGPYNSAPGDTASNSVVNADIRIQAGKLVVATMRHRAATLTLKLVNKPGGEALANTNFTILTPGGDVIRELIGAFPSVVLAEGEYVAIARNNGKTYQSVFKVQSALDTDVEVIAK
jgi:hypothetical protein